MKNVHGPTQTGRRRPGRPRAEAANQREQLLDAAVFCYAEHGIAAASVRRIAARAGVTPALVHYYFGSKAQLLGAVIEERLMPVVAAMREAVDAAGEDPRALVAAFVHGMHGAVAHHPWLPSLWVREVLPEGGALRNLLLDQISPRLPQLLARRFLEARRGGRLNADLDPRLLVVSLIGLTLFPLAAASIWRPMFDASDVDAGALLRHTLALLDHGLGGTDAA